MCKNFLNHLVVLLVFRYYVQSLLKSCSLTVSLNNNNVAAVVGGVVIAVAVL